MVFSSLKRHIQRSLRTKLFFLVSLLIALITITFTTYFILHEITNLRSQQRREGLLLASVIASQINLPLFSGAREEIAMKVATLSHNQQTCSIKVSDVNGDLIVDIPRNLSESTCPEDQLIRQVLTDIPQSSPEAILLGENPSSRTFGTIELIMGTEESARSIRKIIYTTSLLAFGFWLLATGITLTFLQKITATFQILMTGVQRIEDGEFTPWIPVVKDDEPGRALAAINRLAKSLQKQTEEKEALQAEIVRGLHRQIDEEKNRNMAKLIQTNRMTSLGLLVSSMAHEINNPNGAIRLAAEILDRGWRDLRPVLDEVAGDIGEFKLCGLPYTDAIDDIEKAVDAIIRSSIRIEHVVSNLRSYSLGSRDKQVLPFNLNRVVENSIAIVRAHGKIENITIRTELLPELPDVYGNPFQLEQVVINLLLNAIQAMTLNNGSLIEIRTKLDQESGDPLLQIIDSGPGIAAESLAHIFEPFYSTRIEQGGSGLGLYIAKFIVTDQNGTLNIDNIAGGGCKAIVKMPATLENGKPNRTD